MSGIRKRGNSYAVSVTVKGNRQTATCKTREEAEEVQANIRAKLYLVPSERMPRDFRIDTRPFEGWTIGKAAEACELAVWKGTANEVGAVRNAACAVQFFGANTPLDLINTVLIDGYQARLKQIGNSDATVNRKLAALSRIMTFARKREMMTKRPSIDRKREIGGRIRFLTQEEEVTLLAHLSSWQLDCHAEVVCVLADTGLRTGELWKLEARDVDETHGLLSIWRNKSEKPRSVPMTMRVREIISRRMTMVESGPLFAHHNVWMERGWDRARKAMGFEGDKQFVPHALRHTCASRLVQRRVPLGVVQEWLGHKSIEVTRRYSHFRPVDLMEAVKVLEAC